jgi:oxalate decarboxylase
MSTPSTTSSTPLFHYSLEGATPQLYVGGTNKMVTSANMATLSGLSLSSLRVESGFMRGFFWHLNAHALSYCLSGQGEIGMFLSGNKATIIAIQPGTIVFVPIGTIYYIRNTGSEVLHMLVAFTHQQPESLNLSDTLGDLPRPLLAQTFGLSVQDFPALPQQQNQFMVNVSSVSSSGASSSASYAAHLNDIPAQTFSGGIVKVLTPQFIPALDGISLFYLQGTPGALREPHWHPNAHELGYYVEGRAQIEIIAPELHEKFVVQPGDIALIPQNYFHYIDNVSSDPLTIVFFFSNSKPSRVDISQVMSAFPHELLAACFGSDLHIFDNIPNLGDVVVAAKQT